VLVLHWFRRSALQHTNPKKVSSSTIWHYYACLSPSCLAAPCPSMCLIYLLPITFLQAVLHCPRCFALASLCLQCYDILPSCLPLLLWLLPCSAGVQCIAGPSH
jgi:hypothetical protein